MDGLQFTMEHPFKMDDLGVPCGTHILGNPHVAMCASR